MKKTIKPIEGTSRTSSSKDSTDKQKKQIKGSEFTRTERSFREELRERTQKMMITNTNDNQMESKTAVSEKTNQDRIEISSEGRRKSQEVLGER